MDSSFRSALIHALTLKIGLSARGSAGNCETAENGKVTLKWHTWHVLQPDSEVGVLISMACLAELSWQDMESIVLESKRSLAGIKSALSAIVFIAIACAVMLYAITSPTAPRKAVSTISKQNKARRITTMIAEVSAKFL